MVVDFIKKFKARLDNKTQMALDRRVNSMYQIRERGGELWLTYEGCYVCPCDMLRDAPVEAVKKMRMLYKAYLHNG